MPAGNAKTLAAALFFCVLSAGFGAQAALIELRGHVPSVVPQLTSEGLLAPTNQLSLALGLPLRDEGGLDEFIRELYDPASPNFHKFITPAEFTARFGPTEADYAAVENFARTNGLAITGTSANRLLLDVAGPAATVENAFHITLRTYRHPTEARDFFAPDTEPSVDAGIPISHINGLDNFLIPRPANRILGVAAKPSGSLPASGSSPEGWYMGNDFRAAYAPGVALNGAGQTVALFELEGYYASDIATYVSVAQLPGVALTNILVDSFSGVPTLTDTNGVIEVSLDIEMAISMATNLSKVVVYEAANNGGTTADLLNRIVSDNIARQISSSWLIGDNASFDTAYKEMAAQGQTFLQASGDDGAFYSGIAESADDTNITLVGGTTLTMNGSGGSYASETVWNWYHTGEGAAAGGGGISLNNLPIPSWQTGVSTTTNQGSATIRNVPDVALTADNILVVAENGTHFDVGGTSAAAPLWAGFTALVNQQAAVLGGSPPGFLNPAVYAIGKGTNYQVNFHDITTGNNTNPSVLTKYFAEPGYDLCTGWGTPNGQNLINTLVPPDSLVVTPLNGINFAGVLGGPFYPASQNYLLTNSSAIPLAWSLVNTSAWLSASATNGMLAAGTATNLMVGPGASAGSLGLGTYFATIQFTNGNTHLVQTLPPFSLQVFEPMNVLPTNALTSTGFFGGPFTSQNYTLTNASAAAFSWQAGSTSAWLNVSPASGTISGGGQVTVTASLNSAANSLALGSYTTTVFFTNQTTGTVFNRQFVLVVSDPLIITPTNGFAASGPAGGPFSPTAQNYILTNASATAMNWQSGNTSVWLNVLPANGTISGGGQAAVTASLNSAASNLVAGIYAATIFFTNRTSGTVFNRQFVLYVGQPLVQNNGFETGDFTSWTLSGTGYPDNFVTNTITYNIGTSRHPNDITINPHSGTYCALLGQPSVLAYLSQTLPTAAGQSYLLSLWLDSPDGETPNEFSVSWNGSTLFDQVNLPKLGWTNLQFIVTASSSSTVLQIGGRDDPAFLALDDVSVTPGFAPSITTSPTNLTVFSGGNAIFAAAVSGSTNLVFQWRKNGTNLVNGTGISGVTTNVLALTGVTTNSSGNYSLFATNIFGAVTSSVAVLTVVVPAGITSSSLTNSTLQCGSNISYSISAIGTAPLAIQWSVGGTPVVGATNSTLSLTNVHEPGFAVAVTVTNLYASVTSNATLTVVDTMAPVITLNGNSRMTNQIGSPFIDPGATAYDLCAGAVPVTTNGVVNVNVIGTNTLTYTATDGNGNTNTATRTVVVLDTTTPTILWSFTNLVVSLGANCTALMTNVTGTNFIIATNLSGPLVISQMPTNGATLSLGTNLVVITVADPYGNMAYSTNQIVARDTALPVIAGAPQSQTNYVGGTASFSVIATACTPIAYQWLYGSAILAAQTNSSLMLSNLTLGNGGNYSVAVTSAGGSVTSAVAVLTVNRSPCSLVLASSLNPDGFKYSLVFNAAVTPTNASGTVQFFTNGAAFDLEPLVAGSANSANIATLPRGTNLIAAIYSGDVNYLSATNSLQQIVTNHPPVVTPVSFPLIAGLTLTIPVTNLAAYWSDADGDMLSISAISPSANGVIITNTTPNLFYADTNYVNDQFVVTVNDGFGGTNFQAVSILIMPQTNTTPYVAGVASHASGFTLTLNGGYGSTYVLESATNIISSGWMPIATNTLGITGVWQFTDTEVTNFPNRFYRLELVP